MHIPHPCFWAPQSLRQFAGYLKKKSPTALVGWQTRWFELKDRRLLYYKSEHDKKPLGRLDLDLIKIKVQVRNFTVLCNVLDI